MKNLYLDNLKDGVPGITNAIGTFLAEAAGYCLDAQGHQSGVVLKVIGDFEADFSLHWTGVIDDKIKKAWADEKEATEYAATAIAILLVHELTDYFISKRLRQGDRADYFLEKRNISNKNTSSALLEISGIFEEHARNTINARVRIKKENIDKIPNRNLTAVIIVVAFNIAKAKIIIYD